MLQETYKETVELAAHLVRIKSENPGDGEDRVQAELNTRFQAAGIETAVVKTASGRQSLLARIKGVSDRPGLMLTGHADVVPVSAEERPDWQADPYAATILDGRLYGRGSTDMKGGLAAGAVAFCAYAASGQTPVADLLFVSTADEENRMTGSRAVLDHPWLKSISHALVMEPTGLNIAVTGNGRTFGTVTCLGQKAHGAVPSVAKNAILIMQDIISKIMAFDLAEAIGAPGSFWQPIAISAGIEPGIVPDRCSILLDARLAWPADPRDVWVALTDRLRDYDVRIEPLDLRRTWQAPPDDRLAAELATALVAVGITGAKVSFPGSTDGNIFLERGIQPIICGPGTLALAHRANEYVAVSELEQAAAVYAQVIRLWPGSP